MITSAAPLAHWARCIFTVDLRSLALMRMSLALVMMVDLALRSADLGAFYSDAGVMPRDWTMLFNGPWRFSLYYAQGGTWFAGLLFAINFLAAASLFLGYRTVLAAVLCYVLRASLNVREPMVLIGGDDLMILLSFWCMLLPVAARYSVDAALSTQPPPKSHAHFSWASAAVVLQVLSVYFFSACLKRGPEWWPDGSAVYYAMHLEAYSTALGRLLLQAPLLMQGLSYFVYGLELIGPLLLLQPYWQSPLRFVVAGLLMLMHIGFAFCLNIGPFPFISLASLTVLIGSGVWDRLGRGHRLGEGVTLFYDRDCGFCRRLCALMVMFLVLPRAAVRPAQDDPDIGPLLEREDSWVIVTPDGGRHLRWSAFMALVAASPLAAPLRRVLSARLFTRIGDAGYRLIARHRAMLAHRTAWFLAERSVSFTPGPLRQAVAAVVLFTLLAWNFGTVGLTPRPILVAISPPLLVLRLDQVWDMFAPAPMKTDGWFVVPGVLENGRTVDVLHPERETLSYAKPADVAAEYRDIRWRTYLVRLWFRQYADNRLYYARYLCREWNRDAAPGARLVKLKLVYLLEATPPPGEPWPPTEQRVLWTHDCVAPQPEPGKS